MSKKKKQEQTTFKGDKKAIKAKIRSGNALL